MKARYIAMKTSKLSRTAGLLLIAGAGTSLIAHSTACSKDSPPAAKQDTIVIGLSVSLSGDNKGVGAALRDGSQVAVNLINSKGGVLGKRLELSIKDDASDNSLRTDPATKQPIPNAGAILRDSINGLLDQKVVAILGPGASVQLDEAQRLAYPRDDAGATLPGAAPTLMISAWATSPTITTVQPPWPGRYLFRTAPSDTGQRRAMFKLMREGSDVVDAGSEAGAEAGVGTGGGAKVGTPHPCNSPALVYGDDILGRAFNEYLGPQYTNDLKLPFLAIPAPTGESTPQTYQDIISQLIGFKPDCIALVLYAEVAKGFIPLLKQQTRSNADFIAKKTFYIGNDALRDNDLLAQLRKATPSDGPDGMFGVIPNTQPDSGNYREFLRIYHTQMDTVDGGGADPQPYSTNAFDAVVLLALAMQRAGTSTDTVKVRDALIEVSRGFKGSATSGNGKTISPANLNDAFSTLSANLPIDYEGASGPVNFDNSGDVTSGYLTWKVPAGSASYQDLITWDATELPP